MRLTLGKKLGLGFGLMIVLITLLAAVVYLQVGKVTEHSDKMLTENVPSVQHGLQIQSKIHHALSMHRGYMILGLPALAEERLEAWQAIDHHVGELNELSTHWKSDKARAALTEFQTVITDFRAAQDQIAEVSHTEQNVPSRTLFFNDAMPHGTNMTDALNDVLALERDQEATAERKLLVERVSAAKAHLLRAARAVTQFLVDGDDASLAQVGQEVEDCQASVDRLMTMTHLLTDEQRAHFDRYISEREVFLDQAKQAVALRSADDWNKAEHICLNTVTPLASKADQLMQVVIDEETAAQTQGGAALTDSANTLLMVTVVTAVVSVVLGSVVALFLSRRITAALLAVVDRAKAIAGKDLSVEPLDIRSRDEIGDLSQALNDMLDSLRGIITDVTNASTEVASASAEIAASSEQMAHGMAEQQQQTTQVSSAVEQMAATVVEVTRKSADASTTADEAGQRAGDGGRVVDQTIAGINDIAVVVNASAEAIRELGKRSEQIGQVIEVINDIAEQTNLLALNAAIEAARAGEHGRGFAVVADEVRKLADRTTKATDEIANSIRTIQEETTSVVHRMEQGTDKVQQGVDLATEAGQSLQAILEGSNTVATMIQSIATASEEQSAAAEQISSNVESIASLSQQSADGAQQAAEACTGLSQKSEQLQQLVSQFKL